MKVTLIVSAVIGQAWKLLGDHKYKKMMKKWLQQYPVFVTCHQWTGIRRKKSLRARHLRVKYFFFFFFFKALLGLVASDPTYYSGGTGLSPVGGDGFSERFPLKSALLVSGFEAGSNPVRKWHSVDAQAG